MTIVLALLLLFSPLAADAPQQLRRSAPQLTSDDKGADFERGIPPATRGAFNRYLTPLYKGPDYNHVIAALYRMPSTTDQYFAVVHKGDENQDKDQVFFLLLRKERETITEVSRVSVENICMLSETKFFTGRDRILIITSISAGDGGFCGNYALEFRNGNLKSLGELNVYDGVAGKGAFQGSSPLERATAEYKNNSYYVTLRGRGILYSLDEKDRKLANRGMPLTFVSDGKSFQPVRNRSKP